MPTTLTASDSFALSDAIALKLGTPVSRAGGDNLFFADSAKIRVDYLPKPSDQLVLSDHLKIQRSIAFSFSDSLTLVDSAGAPIIAVELRLSFNDSLSLSDTSSASLSSALDMYLRRYLNDVS